MVAPFLRNDNQVVGVLELIRFPRQPQFDQQEVEVVDLYLAWASFLLIHENSSNVDSLNTALLEIFRYRFYHMYFIIINNYNFELVIFSPKGQYLLQGILM